jgi:hypothetical protein
LHEPIQQLVALHEDVGRSVVPAGLEAQSQPTIGAFLEAVELAVVAAQAQEALREDAAPEVGAKLLLDEAWTGMVASTRVCEEGLELLAHHLVQEGLLGAAGCVAVCGH